jgi:hypothetical protein
MKTTALQKAITIALIAAIIVIGPPYWTLIFQTVRDFWLK